MPWNEIFALLVSAIVVVVLLHRLKASPVLGFLVAGVMIGPTGFGLVGKVADIRTVADLGVVFLLFLVGLELSFDRLRTMRRLVFGLGGAQVGVTGAAIGAAAWAWGNSPEAALVLGLSLALSSTAVVLQLLIERGEMASRAGRASFAVLLFQDLLVVPLLVLVPLLGAGEGSLAQALSTALAKALLAAGAILVVGRYALRPPFRWVAATRNAELFVALALLVVLGTGWITQWFGLSMALGAFLAGLVLAETEYRHQVEADIKPFKGLLLGLFFMAVGMTLDLGAIAGNLAWVGAAVAGLIGLKAAIAAALCRAFGLPGDVALRTGLLLGEGGEFAFVVVGAAAAAGVIAPDVAQFMIAVTCLSMLLTPALAWGGARLAATLARRAAGRAIGPEAIAADQLEQHILVAGFGRVGQTVSRLLDEQKVPYIALDLDPVRVRDCRARGQPVVYGDATRADVLARLGADRAAALVVTLDNPDAARRAVGGVRRAWPHLKLFVRAHDDRHLAELKALGADDVVPETLESSLTLARQALGAVGVPADAIARLGSTARAPAAADAPAAQP